MSNPVKKDDMGLIYLGCVALLFGLVIYIWHLDKLNIIYYTTKLDYYLLVPFSYIYPDLFVKWQQEAINLAFNATSTSFDKYFAYMNKVGYLYVWIPIILSIRGIKIAMNHKDNFTRRRVTIDTLPWIMSKHSPAIIPCLYYGEKEDLLLNVDPPEHRSALTPTEWVIKNGLLIDGVLDKVKTLDLFKQDLGEPLTNINDLKPHEKALFAVFGARLLSDGEDLADAQKLLDELNKSCHTHTFNGMRGYPNLEIANKLFDKYSKHKDCKIWLKKHLFSKTLLHSMHKNALQLGKLPSSNFRWLKGMDRSLWYALNTTGRKTPFIESTAVFTQTLWEVFAYENGYEIKEPLLDDAVEGLESYLIRVGLIYPKSK